MSTPTIETTVVPASGTSVPLPTGSGSDAGAGAKRPAPRQRRSSAGSKPAGKSGSAPAKSSKSSKSSKPAGAVKPAERVQTPAQSKPAGVSINAKKRAMSERILRLIANDVRKMSDAQLKRAGFTREEYGSVAGAWMNYLPADSALWDELSDAFGKRTGAGRRS